MLPDTHVLRPHRVASPARDPAAGLARGDGRGRDPSRDAGRHLRCGLPAATRARRRGARGIARRGQARLYRARPDGSARSDRCSRACGTTRCGGSSCRPSSPRHAPRAGAASHAGNTKKKSECHESPSSSRSHRRHSCGAADRLLLLHRQRTLGVMVGSRIRRSSAKPGGRVYIRHPAASRSLGEVIEVARARSHRVHVWIRERQAHSARQLTGDDRARARGPQHAAALRSRVRETRLLRDEHVQGWRFQLSLFGNVVANLVHARATEAGRVVRRVGRNRRGQAGGSWCGSQPDVRFHDRYSLLEGLDDLVPHIGATQQFMPGMRVRRKGDVQHCQGTLLVDWIAAGTDGRSAPRVRMCSRCRPMAYRVRSWILAMR